MQWIWKESALTHSEYTISQRQIHNHIDTYIKNICNSAENFSARRSPPPQKKTSFSFSPSFQKWAEHFLAPPHNRYLQRFVHQNKYFLRTYTQKNLRTIRFHIYLHISIGRLPQCSSQRASLVSYCKRNGFNFHLVSHYCSRLKFAG